MPNAARQIAADSPPSATPAEVAVWSGDALGPVGAMHRVIEERMLVGAEMMAVLPLQARPGDVLVRTLSRAAGWGAVATCAATVIGLLLS